MLKKIGLTTFSVAALVGGSLANAAYFDFQGWIAVNGEHGFDNSAPFSLTEDGLTLTATATEAPSGTASHVYMDDLYNGIIGGMGVCSVLAGDQCNPSSDDNVSIDGGNEEILSWNLGQNITEVTLELGNTDHFDYANNDIYYRYDSGLWTLATSDADALLTLTLDGSSNMIEFKAVGSDFADHFYIRNADITIVPVPAALWLFASGLLGLVAVSRRRV
jgi:hypothetical protein